MQQEKTITSLEWSYQELKEQLVLANIELENQTQVLNVQIQDYKGNQRWLLGTYEQIYSKPDYQNA